ECPRREVRRRRFLPTAGERHGPVDRQPGVVVLSGDGEQLERRVRRVLLLPEATENVAVRGCERRNLPPALVELGQRTYEGRPEVRDDDIDLRVLGDICREHLLGKRRVPVRYLE